MRFFNFDAELFRFANAAAAGAFHTIKQDVLGLGQIGAVGTVELRRKAKAFCIFKTEMRVGDFEVQTLELVPGEFLERCESVVPGDTRVEIESHVGSGPSGKRTA